MTTQSKPLTFKELGFGKWFIAFPIDGDDSGHGGYRGRHHLFIKTGNNEALKLLHSANSHMLDDMQVLEVG